VAPAQGAVARVRRQVALDRQERGARDMPLAIQPLARSRVAELPAAVHDHDVGVVHARSQPRHIDQRLHPAASLP
jgi:hypothetical protein